MEFHLSSFRHCKVLEKPNLSLFPGWHFGGQAGSALPALLTGGRNVRFWQDLKCYPKWSKGQADLGWCGVYLKILFLYLYQVYISLFLDFRLVFFFFPHLILPEHELTQSLFFLFFFIYNFSVCFTFSRIPFFLHHTLSFIIFIA